MSCRRGGRGLNTALLLLWAGLVVSNAGRLLVAGSVNADVIVPLDKLPRSGETVVARDNLQVPAGTTVPGGKGANQAVAASRLGATTSFLCQFGNDGNADMLETALKAESLNLKHSKRVALPSGTGLVLLIDGGSTCIVCSGSNGKWDTGALESSVDELFAGNDEERPACLLLQMEVPGAVNLILAKAAKRHGVPVFQDLGGEDRPLSEEHMRLCDFVSPNLSELERATMLPCSSPEQILAAAKALQNRGARNVLVTLGDAGSLLLTENGDVLRQGVVKANVVDETGAGDNYRAAFCVSHFAEKKSLQESMEWAAAAAAVSVGKMGAIPACCRRGECEAALKAHKLSLLSGGGWFGGPPKGSQKTEEKEKGEEEKEEEEDEKEQECPWKFASRLNSMSARADLYETAPFGSASGPPVQGLGLGVRGWIRRQGTVRGLDLVDFNYPQHLAEPVSFCPEAKAEVLSTLQAANLSCGAVCLRFPKPDMQLGALTHPDREMRKRAIRLCCEACEWAEALSPSNPEVVIWSAFCGYDYSLQADYATMWRDVVLALREICDKHPKTKVSLEFKPTDENTRFFAVPSTGAAVLLTKEVARSNFGLTLDFGHCLMAGENPAQSAAMMQQLPTPPHLKEQQQNQNQNQNQKQPLYGSGKLFGVQLGDGHSRIGAEDGLVFGSVHHMAALELVYYLLKTDYKGHIYFDTFPRNEDPVREASRNIQTFKKLYRTARRMLGKDKDKIEKLLRNHDALGMLEYLDSKM